MANRRKTAESICLLSRDDDGEVTLWNPRVKSISKIAGMWGTAWKFPSLNESAVFINESALLWARPGEDPTIALPLIRKGSKARVRVTVEVLGDE